MLLSMGDVNIIQTYFLRSLGDPKTLVEIIEKKNVNDFCNIIILPVVILLKVTW